MLQLITVALATFTTIMGLYGILPFLFPPRLAPFLVSGAAFGISKVPAHWYDCVQAAAVAGLVVVIHRFAVTQNPEPWSVRDLAARVAVRLSRPPKTRPGRSPIGNRIPRL